METEVFNYIAMLFRGKDHLTLADWKNSAVGYAAGTSYLTDITDESTYNFKSDNKPTGTRMGEITKKSS